MWSLNSIWEHLGWAVLHSLWQGALVLAAVALIRRWAGDARPGLSYASGVLGLVAIFAAFLATLAVLMGGASSSAALPTGSLPTLDILGFAATGADDRSSFDPASVIPVLGLIWCVGFFALVLQCMYAWARTRVMATVGLSAPEADWTERFARLVAQSGLTQRVRLHVSALVDSPVTLGTLKPIVLVPAGFLTGFPPAQVEAILLHELAHIRRHDFLLGLIQTAIRTTLYFNPAVRVLSNWVNEDREQACDDFAVRRTGRPNELAKGLARLRLQAEPKLAMAATGNGKGQLVTRLERLMGRPARTRRERLPAAVMAGLVVGTVVVGSAALPTASWAHPIPGEDTPLPLQLDDTTVLAGDVHTPPVPPIAPLPPMPPVGNIPALPAMPPLPVLTDYDSKQGFENAMEAWGEKMEGWSGKMEVWGENLEENWGEDFEDRMESWAEKMEDWGEHVEEQGLHIEALDDMSPEELRALGLSEADVEAYAEAFGLDVAEQVVTAMLPSWMSDDVSAEIDEERREIDRERIANVERAMKNRTSAQTESARERAEQRAQAARERARAARETAQAERERRHAEREIERAKRDAERERARAERDAERTLRRAELQRRHAERKIEMRQLASALRDQLEADGLLDRDKDGYEIKITDKTLHVCGRRQSEQMRKRYTEWIKDADIESFDLLRLEVDDDEIDFELRDGSSTTRVTMN